ncbi:MAG: MnhB domain-containing protein [Lachnospiraceae bacterium]|nr:MnhB domain-containing protein [Lachnospiraceae bacterium]
MTKKKSKRRERFFRWLDGDYDVLEHIMDSDEHPYIAREEYKREQKEVLHQIEDMEWVRKTVKAERKGFMRAYRIIAVVSCIFLIGVLLYAVSFLPRYGTENPQTLEVVKRYVEQGLEETGAVNIVAGMILDYRAFDTLGESHVLFTALICVMILLRKDSKNMSGGVDSYNTISKERFHRISTEAIMRNVGMLLIPSIFIYGIYVLLNGQNGPGGGFSGGAVMGAGLIIMASSMGFTRVDKFFTAKVSAGITAVSLGFYSFAKSYVFFTGANGLENHIPKGTPGAILSGGLILPLDIAVGLVVMCTMFGFYSLFRRGSIGGK